MHDDLVILWLDLFMCRADVTSVMQPGRMTPFALEGKLC